MSSGPKGKFRKIQQIQVQKSVEPPDSKIPVRKRPEEIRASDVTIRPGLRVLLSSGVTVSVKFTLSMFYLGRGVGSFFR
ncbi:hypothetical protein [Methanosarcina sp. KYL-1]|uniref:hypothetical protein n=1 Tax=Methanosarcina sp. KYL-1 TaxID=2602068 RepID=UPI0021007095|nr:hypothetical protein [Methanosarcina sp. KYL-1]